MYSFTTSLLRKLNLYAILSIAGNLLCLSLTGLTYSSHLISIKKEEANISIPQTMVLDSLSIINLSSPYITGILFSGKNGLFSND